MRYILVLFLGLVLYNTLVPRHTLEDYNKSISELQDSPFIAVDNNWEINSLKLLSNPSQLTNWNNELVLNSNFHKQTGFYSYTYQIPTTDTLIKLAYKPLAFEQSQMNALYLTAYAIENIENISLPFNLSVTSSLNNTLYRLEQMYEHLSVKDNNIFIAMHDKQVCLAFSQNGEELKTIAVKTNTTLL